MAAPRLVHCSYHKCLTVYYGRVMGGIFNRVLPWSAGYKHFNSDLAAFYQEGARYSVSSVNNHAVDLERLGRFRMTRFIRDPRDLVVSGYFYHRRGAEPWTQKARPGDLAVVNGAIPEGMQDTELTFSGYLQSLSEEEGLLAELEFRRPHFESMAAFDDSHPDVLTLRYEDLVGNEEAAFASMFAHYELGRLERLAGMFFVRRHARPQKTDKHVRNPASGQWRKRFTPRVREAFEAQHPGLAERLGYAAD